MQNNNQSQLASALLIAAVIVGGAILLKDSTPPVKEVAPTPVINVPGQARPVSQEDHIIGNSNAKITIIEYSDLDCPFCQRFHITMKQVIASNSDVAWVYRHFPLTSIHPDAFKKAEATECAWDQGGNDAFWTYTDSLFERTYSVSELSNLAGSLGLNTNTFNTCLSSGKFAAKVQADLTDGSGVGARGTPYSVILVDGQIVDTIEGNQPLSVINEKLKALR